MGCAFKAINELAQSLFMGERIAHFARAEKHFVQFLMFWRAWWDSWRQSGQLFRNRDHRALNALQMGHRFWCQSAKTP
jgi:hypothetical protein